MQSYKEQQEEISKTSSVINAKKQTKTTEWETLEAEDIKKSWQEYTEKLYKKELHNQDKHDGVIIHLEPDILECEVKWPQKASLQTKLVEVLESQLSYFKP